MAYLTKTTEQMKEPAPQVTNAQTGTQLSKQHTAFTILSGKTQRSQTEVFGNNGVLKQYYDPMRAW